MIQFVTLTELREAAHAGLDLLGARPRAFLRLFGHIQDATLTVAVLPDDAESSDLYAAWHGPCDAVVWLGAVFGPRDDRGYRRDADGPWAALRRVEGRRGEVYWLPYWPDVYGGS